jgi:serine/threonine-protein kinase
MRQEHIGPYQVTGVIGEGGMGQVLHAVDRKMGREVAIKVIHASLLGKTSIVQRAQRELQALVALSGHPNVVTVYDYVPEPFAIVMELLRGGSLADRIRKAGGPLPLDQVFRYAKPILNALQYAHDQGLLHRDMKPANVMIVGLGREEAVKVMDFGLTGFVGGASGLTRTGTRMGTPAYMAPEQHLGRACDERTDVYSFGVSLFEMCTGRQPFPESLGSDYQIAQAHVERPVPLPSSLNPKLPAGMDAVIGRCTAKEPERRYASCAEVLADIERVERGVRVEAFEHVPQAAQALRAPTVHEEANAEWPVRRHVPWGVVLGVAAAAVVLGGIVAIVTSSAKRDPNVTKREEAKKAVTLETKEAGAKEVEPVSERAEPSVPSKELPAALPPPQPVCARQCAGRSCGPDGCGGDCGKCSANQACNAAGICQCVPQCAGKQCGPDGCGGSCWKDQGGEECEWPGQCEGFCPERPEQCENGQCVEAPVPSGMVMVTGGRFTRGGSGKPNAPETEVMLSYYAIDEYLQTGSGNIVWDDADRACRQRGLLLASEAQWESAAVKGHFSRATGGGYSREAEWVRDWYGKDNYGHPWGVDPVADSIGQADYRPGVTAKYLRRGETKSDYCRVCRGNPYGSCTDWQRCRSFWMPDNAANYGWRCVKEY